MTYVIGGTPRSGKSVLKEFFLKKYGVPGFCTDYLRDALEHNVPQFGIKNRMSDAKKSEILWPYFKGILTQRNKYYKDELLVEGTNFLPKYLKEFIGTSSIRIVFLGYTEVNQDEKLTHIRNYPNVHDEWTQDIDDEELRKLVSQWVEISKYFRF